MDSLNIAGAIFVVIGMVSIFVFEAKMQTKDAERMWKVFSLLIVVAAGLDFVPEGLMWMQKVFTMLTVLAVNIIAIRAYRKSKEEK